ncbi:phosphatase PAP2 family protein, partial [Streptomyces sp. NRRL S-244]|uniref:phosphatase PAP2 family protein n=1 Tax=Streptomyces sp. NRRL S-244 TaxID=1463897 RepID=UPI0005616C5A
MENEIRPGMARAAVLTPTAAGIAGALGLLWLAPDGPVPEGGASARGYRAVTGWVADGPRWTGALLEAATEGTLVLLGLLLAAVGWRALRRRDAGGIAGTVLVGLGTVAAYVLSEAVKSVVDEERPCRALRDAVAVAVCPEPGDWSFPSNHATLAVALAVGVAVLRPVLAAAALPLGAVAALLRVAVGVHYPHDVLAGAVLGCAVVAGVLAGARPWGTRLVSG